MPANGLDVGTAEGNGGADVEPEACVGGSVDVANSGIAVESAGDGADAQPRINSEDNPASTATLNIQ